MMSYDPWLAGGHQGPGAEMQNMGADKFYFKLRGFTGFFLHHCLYRASRLL